MEYNGGSVVAMVGKDCVAIASDLRLGNQAMTIATNFEKVRNLHVCLRMCIHRRMRFGFHLGVPCNRPDIPWASGSGD